MLSALHAKKIPLREIAIRPQLVQPTKEIFVALVVQGLKYEAQKAFVAYLRSVYFAANKLVFDVSKIDLEKFAASLGLPAVPDLSELSSVRSAKNLPWDVVNYIAQRQAAASGHAETPATLKQALTRRERHLEAGDLFRTLQVKQRYAPASSKELSTAEQSDDLFVKRAVPHPVDDLTFDERIKGLSKHKIRNLIKTADLRVKDLGLSKRTVFESTEEAETAGDGEPLNKAETPVGEEKQDEFEFAEELREQLAATKENDRVRVKELKTRRKLRKEGKLVTTSSLQPDADDESIPSDEEEEERDSTGAAPKGRDEALEELLKAARGELYEGSSEDEEPEEATTTTTTKAHANRMLKEGQERSSACSGVCTAQV